LGTLADLKDKVGKERDAALKAEEKEKKDFKDWESGLATMIENGKKSLADIKSSIAQSQETSSQKQASLTETKDILKAEEEHLAKITAEFRGKTQSYKVRLIKRSDEAMAVHEAKRLLNSEVAKSLVKQQTVGTVAAAASFIQLKQEDRRAVQRKALYVLKHATTPGLALLAIQSTTHRHRGDPFAKVKNMIKGMLEKLMAKQAQESKHAAWCDHEMGKTTKDQTRKEKDVQKLKDRLEALTAALSETKEDLITISGDLKDMQEASSSAVALRQKEKMAATLAIKQYKDGADLLTRAAKVLKAYYHNKSQTDDVKGAMKQRAGMGTGIIGILEIAIDDFSKLYKDTKEAEEAAERDFKDMQQETEIRTAVFEKDQEWKTRSKVKMEFDEATMKNDLKSYEKELTAIESYLEKLKASCVVKGPSYEEKKARREAELTSLKEALTFLAGQ